MRFLTSAESHDWASGHSIALNQSGRPARNVDGLVTRRWMFPSVAQLNWWAGYISKALTPRHKCLAWVTDFEIFQSGENQHLYYRLRQSYGDLRLLHEAPGHLFLEHEAADLATVLGLSVLNSWDVHVLPELQYGGPDTARAFICHDGWFELSHRDVETVSEWERALHNLSTA